MSAPPVPLSELSFSYWFHPDFSDSTLRGRTTYSYASPLIVYHFAFQFMQSPSELSSKVLPQTVQDQVQIAIEAGNSLYDELYAGKEKELSIEETLNSLKPDISMTEVSRRQTNISAEKVIHETILYLKHNQLLLIFFWKPYKVISVICTADPNSVCVLDSQLHRVSEYTDYGAFLLYAQQEPFSIAGLYAQMQVYGVLSHGKCDLEKNVFFPFANQIMITFLKLYVFRSFF